MSYNTDRETIDFRHYVITVKPYGVSKRVRRVLEGVTTQSASTSGILDLGNEKDVADFMLRRRGEPGPEGGYESAASSTESVAGDDGDAVSLADDYVGRNNKKGQRRAVRLDEVGPRMELRLVKIAEGVPGKEGNVIYHHFSTSFFFSASRLQLIIYLVKKTKKEIAVLQADHAAKAKLKKERREEQDRNVQRKEALAKSDGQNISDDDTAKEDEEAVGDDDNGIWDGNEAISEGEESGSEEDESCADEELEQPLKKSRIR